MTDSTDDVDYDYWGDDDEDYLWRELNDDYDELEEDYKELERENNALNTEVGYWISLYDDFEDVVDKLKEELNSTRAELSEINKLVNRLKKTADKVPVYTGDVVHFWHPKGHLSKITLDHDDLCRGWTCWDKKQNDWAHFRVSDSFYSKEAAEESRILSLKKEMEEKKDG